MHLAVGQGADRLAVLSDIRDQHHRGMIAHELLGVDYRRRSKLLGETDFVLLAQLLVAQEDHEVLVPGVPNSREGEIVDLAAQIDTDDLGAERRRQRPHDECRTMHHLRLDMFRCHPDRSLFMPRLPH
jgi:hypothetical protein